jgi:hypothetical protein
MSYNGTGGGGSGPAAKRHKSTEAPPSTASLNLNRSHQSAPSTDANELEGRERTLDAIAAELGLRGRDGRAGGALVHSC